MENIRIAVLNAYDQVCTFLDNSISNCMHYCDDELHTYLSGSAYTFTFTTYTSYEDTQFLTVGNKISFYYKSKGYYCNIVNVEKTETKIKITAYGLSFELLNEETGEYNSQQAMSFTEYIEAFNFENQILEIGINEVSDKKISNEWTGTETILARLFSLANVFDAEIEFITELNSDYSLGGIVLNVYKKHDTNVQGIGTDRRSEIIRYGINIRGISKTSDITELYTAIRPTGTDGLTIAELNKSEYDENGNLEYYSPAGTIEILAPQARDRFPSTLTASTNDRYIAKIWTYETDNVNTLYGQALAQLKKNCVPQISYEIEGFIDAGIGDTFTIEDTEYNPTLYLEARITEQTICFTDKTRCSTKFDNFKEVQSKIDESLLDQVNKLIDANKQYASSIISTNGTIFKNDTDTTTLKALVLNGTEDVTDSLTIQWYIDGVLDSTSREITISQEDLKNDKVTCRFEGISNAKIKANAEVTIVKVVDGKQGEKGDSGIIVSTEEPKDPTVGQLWQTEAEAPIKRWDGNEWIVHYLSVENLKVKELSAFTADLGDITAGSININDLFLVDKNGNLTAKSGNISGLKISKNSLSVEAVDASGAVITFLIAADGTITTTRTGDGRNYYANYGNGEISLISQSSSGGADRCEIKIVGSRGIEFYRLNELIAYINFYDSDFKVNFENNLVFNDQVQPYFKLVDNLEEIISRTNKNIEFIKDKDDKEFIKANSVVLNNDQTVEDFAKNRLYMISGTKTVKATDSSAKVHTWAEIIALFKNEYGVTISDRTKLGISYVNGDGSAGENAGLAHIEGVVWSGDSSKGAGDLLVLFDRALNTTIRINYSYFYIA